MSLARTALAATITILASAPCLRGQSVATDLASRIRVVETNLRPGDGTGWTIEDRMAYYGVPGVSVAVIEDGRLLWAKGYGLKQAGTTDSVDTETVSRSVR